MKKIFFDICYVATIMIISVMLWLNYSNAPSMPIGLLITQGISLLLSFILLIKSFIVWNKHDKRVSQLLMLIFLNIFYLLYYYPAHRKRW